MKQRGGLYLLFAVLLAGSPSLSQESVKPARRAIPKSHPRLFGSAEQILQLSRRKPALWSAGVDSSVTPFHSSQLRRLASFGLAGYATYPENPRALEILDHVKKIEWGEKLLPALREFGAGGGWWEGRGYDTYSIFQFMTWADVARRVEGFDPFAQLPDYFEAKCAHEMFSNYPGFQAEARARRAAVSGDGK